MKTLQLPTITASNNLTFKASKINGKISIYVEISLNDECKNGHQDFHITADIYQAGKPKTDKYFLAFGCLHDEISKLFPQFKQFIALHGCDYQGIPSFVVANGFYHLRQGFNNTKPEKPNFKGEYCEYYRISDKQFDALNQSKNELQFALSLKNLGILEQWKNEANEAIKYLEQLTGTKFLIDSVKSQYIAPTPEEIAAEKEREQSGYYTPESEKQRELAKHDKIIAELRAERDKLVLKADTEYNVKVAVLKTGGSCALKNCIFYNHSNTLSFNWRSYDMISTKMYEKIAAEIKLPEGVKIQNANGK